MPKAYVFTRNGGPETEALIDVDRPEPGPEHLLVAVRAAGVNPVDYKIRNGYRRPGEDGGTFPAVFGGEVSGVVVETGESVTGFAAGQEVFGAPDSGGYAEFAVLPQSLAAHKPAALSFTDAATLPVAAATAYDGVHQLGLAPGATLLITGAGGGVGVAATQIARAGGVRVIGLASEGKKDLLTSLGAVHVASGPGWPERVRAAAPDGLDGIYDLVGGEVFAEAATLAGDGTPLISATVRPEEAERHGGARVERARTAAVLEAVADLVVQGDLDPQVGARFPLERAGEALREVESGHARGKVVIEVSE
ncbi:NADP-dependent oxidoreductase [Streptomyces sp. NPDC091377]|uniref:NADP-dependent oxidoreductase n=1 Tax=Streptomyces sp. NPDC091377 TaxID=3365995 RepID=UPI003820B413